MNNPTTNDLLQGLADAMETLAFVSLAPTDERGVPESPVLCTMTCAKGGETPLRLHMIAPMSLGHLLAANILGTDPSDPDAATRALDSLREIMNVTCGSLCTQVAAESSETIELGLPQSTPIDDASVRWASAIGRPDTQILDADGHVIAVWLEAA